MENQRLNVVTTTIAALAIGYVQAASAQVLPDPLITPGVVNLAITQQTMGKTICNPHWSTRSIRPPPYYTTRLKREQLQAEGATDRRARDYEEDHLVSLELGGAPRDPLNLWPEPWQGACGARVKDRLENRLHDLVCARKITLKQAQTEIATDWIVSYRKHIGPLRCNG